MALKKPTFARTSNDIPTKDKIIVREYVASDYEDILNAKYPFSTAKFGSLYKDLKSKLFDTLGQLETKRLVAYCPEKNQTVGIVTLKEINANLWGASGIYVSPKYRRRGISLRLWRTSFTYLRKKRIRKVVAAVETKNIPSMKGIEKTWDKFLSQKYYEYHGSILKVRNENRSGVFTRDFRSPDRSTLFEIYEECTCEDWRNFLEISKSNFLERIIPGHSFYAGLFKLLLKNRIWIVEGHDGAIKGYGVTPAYKLPIGRNIAVLYLFVPSQLTTQEAVAVFKNLSNVLVLKGFRQVSVFSVNRNEEMLRDFSNVLRTNFRFRTSQNMVCIKTL